MCNESTRLVSKRPDSLAIHSCVCWWKALNFSSSWAKYSSQFTLSSAHCTSAAKLRALWINYTHIGAFHTPHIGNNWLTKYLGTNYLTILSAVTYVKKRNGKIFFFGWLVETRHKFCFPNFLNSPQTFDYQVNRSDSKNQGQKDGFRLRRCDWGRGCWIVKTVSSCDWGRSCWAVRPIT